MHKLLKFSLITIGAIIISYLFLSQTGILKAYKSPTIANEPNLKCNSLFFVSNLATPKIGDFVCYKSEDKILGKLVKVHKLCGMENDIIEIKNGVVYLNNTNIDIPFEHTHTYQISNEEYTNLITKKIISDADFPIPIDANNIRIFIKDSVAKKYGLTSKRMIEEKGKPNEAIYAIFKNSWNKDNFGPIKIPSGKIFVIGDNRDNSEDSRYTGFVNKSDIVGTVIYN